jgi:serine/threonine protein kinase
MQGQYFSPGGVVLDSFSRAGDDTACRGTGMSFVDETGASWPQTMITSGDFEDCLHRCTSDVRCTAFEQDEQDMSCTFYGHAIVTHVPLTDATCFVRDKTATECQPCPPNTYTEDAKHVRSECTPVARCQPGEYMVSSAWPDANQQCAACPSGTFMSAVNHTFTQCNQPTACIALGLPTAFEATIVSDAVCGAAAASRGIGANDDGANSSFAFIVALVLLTAFVVHRVNKHYGTGSIAKEKRAKKLQILTESKIEEGREPDDMSDDDDDDDDIGSGMNNKGRNNADISAAAAAHVTLARTSKIKTRYTDGTVEPRHIEGSRVKLLDKLGEGAFGAVYLGYYESPDDIDGNIGGAYNVAVKVLKQSLLTEKQLSMMTRREIVEQLVHLDNESTAAVSARSLWNAQDLARPNNNNNNNNINNNNNNNNEDNNNNNNNNTGVSVTMGKRGATARYRKQTREELVAELLERQKLRKHEVAQDALTRAELEDETLWTVEDLQREAALMDQDLAKAKYAVCDKDELVQSILTRQRDDGITHGDGVFSQQQLVRMNREQLVQLASEFDAKELCMQTYSAMDKVRLVRAYLQRSNGTATESELNLMSKRDIEQRLLELDDTDGIVNNNNNNNNSSSSSSSNEMQLDASPMVGELYAHLGKDELIAAVLTQQQRIADAEAEAKMKEAYRNFWWEARTMAAICQGSGHLRVKYGRMTKRELLSEAVRRDVEQEVRRRVKRQFRLVPDPDVVGNPRVVMTTAQKHAWEESRRSDWGPHGQDWSADDLTSYLLDLDDKDGLLHGHANIAKIIGIVADEKPDQVVLQLAEGGELKTYLELHNPHTSYKHLDKSALLTMSHDICSGMLYLESQGWIHGDLACRNVLINSVQVCQIADFGLSKYQGLNIENNGLGVDGRPGQETSLKEMKLRYVKYTTQFPVRWCPPEVVGLGRDGKPKRHFSHQSDVWAFGVTVYEIFTWAETPYSRVQDARYAGGGPMRNKDVKKYVLDGNILPCPGGLCSDKVYNDVIAPCWTAKPKDRISFAELEMRLGRHVKDSLHSFRKSKMRFKTNTRRRVIALQQQQT